MFFIWVFFYCKSHDLSHTQIKSEHPIINPEDEGVTFKQIETWFKRKWPDQKGEADIQTAVLEEVAEGRLVILPNKKYILKNWRVTVKDITIKLPENDLAEELVLAGAAAKDQVEDLNKMAVSSSHLSNSCIPFRTDEDNSAPDLVIEEEEQANHKVGWFSLSFYFKCFLIFFWISNCFVTFDFWCGLLEDFWHLKSCLVIIKIINKKNNKLTK